MAQHSFLSADLLEQAREILNPPLTTPDGDVRQNFYFSNENLSSWLSDKIEKLFESYPEWKKSHPILLGSWARGEICPRSDIDLIFCGPEAEVKILTDHLQERGLKIRYRMPQDFSDWTVNVEPFDVLALLKAKPLTSEGAKLLFEQQKKIWSQKKKLRQVILKAVVQERKTRSQRYDSITNYLEPNIKYGPGGLRDLEQGLQIYELFAEKFTNPGYALNVLKYYRNYFLSLRQKLHLDGMNDILVNHAQFDLAQWMGFKTHKEFMRSLQSGFSRVHFYTDWIVEVAAGSEAELKKIEKVPLVKPLDLGLVLHKNASVLMQKRVREQLDSMFPPSKQKAQGKLRGQILKKMLDVKAKDEFLVSVFRSRLIDKLCPEVFRLYGYVQHDQYHRFTADSHIMQACREVKRLYQKPALLGPLKFLSKKLSAYDWEVLSWTALYHDLAKGLESDDHAEQGVEFVKRDFKLFGFSAKLTADVSWMVKNHLELSQSAFRKNPKDPKVWEELKQLKVENENLWRLGLFTAVDIRATNPEAWNDWKAKLLKELIESLSSQRAQHFFDFKRLSRQKRLQLDTGLVQELDAELLSGVPMKVLVEDLKEAKSSFEKGISLKPHLVSTKRHGLWIRFHSSEDRPGLLSQYVTQLYSLGINIRHASIHTLNEVGVYDWFRIDSKKTAAQLAKIFANASFQEKSLPLVTFDSIQLISQDQQSWVISFKGKDQVGLLASAAAALGDLKLSIQSAKVHTWGRQIDDIFVVKAQGDLDLVMGILKSRFSA